MSITLCHDGMTPRDDGGLRVAISIVKNDKFWRTIFRETTLIECHGCTVPATCRSLTRVPPNARQNPANGVSQSLANTIEAGDLISVVGYQVKKKRNKTRKLGGLRPPRPPQQLTWRGCAPTELPATEKTLGREVA